ncbi:hypothetical protein [Sediminitomix flava]|uniref:Uncharacterized protein n=1 Tax=Sediminitomix flava TaxID=379075 RepID=A0A315ZBB6_SEDFL|nr:hypothetical protein [Sediminitomix flava]PWJ42098.1 hypothetical protein BC781_103348 [Sediminitomix flava]
MQSLSKGKNGLILKTNNNYLIVLRGFTLLSITILLFQSQSYAQLIVKDSLKEYPYSLPIWGQKAHKKGIKMPLPIGFSVNYVSSTMGMGISDLTIDLNPIEYKKDRHGEYKLDENGNKIPKSYLGQNMSQEMIDGLVDDHIIGALNEEVTLATANGWNYRMDIYLLPFLNVYGMIADVKGTTSVGLGPDMTTVDFDALAYGGGVSLMYGIKGWFTTVDMNYSVSSTDLIDELVPVSTYSMRIGKKFEINNGKQGFAIYLGAMNRNFMNDKASPGTIDLKELLTNIEDPEEPKLPDAIRNQIISTLENTRVNYSIKKELLQTWTVQCGFSFEFNDHFALRGEYGIAENNKFLMTGLNYRFGF